MGIPMDEWPSFGAWMRQQRRARDLTQDVLAERVHCSADMIHRIETGRARPSRQLAELLVTSLDVPIAERAAFVRWARGTPAPTPPAAPGTELKGYVLEEPIGSGAFGTVYRAIQPGIRREVAVKIIRAEYANQADFIRRFEAEAQFVARLEHPHIVPLYDYWRDPSGAYLVMRWVRGGSLQAALAAGTWSLAATTHLLEQIGPALLLAHRQGVIHRDVKPANILLDEDRNAYLADFGIAKDLGLTGTGEQTVPGTIIGSPAYLTPEQIQSAPVGPSTDVYSLGLVLYEMLSGQPAFRGSTPLEVLDQQLHAPLPPLLGRDADVPGSVNEVLARATAKRPEDRYPDVDSLVVAFRQAGARDSASRTALLKTPPGPEPENPYKGLRAFGEADARDFFGREVLTGRLLARLQEPIPENRFLAVVGPSGSGKSSVVLAGLLPAVRRGALPGADRWFVQNVIPGAHPFEELEAALLRVAVNPPTSLLAQLQEDPRGLVRAVKRVLPDDPATELLLVIDQFEEVFTLVADEATRAHLLASLEAAVTEPRSRLRVVVTLRADFYDRPLLYPVLGELLRQRMEVVLPLTVEELEEAIVQPARRVGVALEPELVATIVRDVGEQPGTLPLLQYALTELFEQRAERTLTLETYRTNGGCWGH